jgi:hypothetical protein
MSSSARVPQIDRSEVLALAERVEPGAGPGTPIRYPETSAGRDGRRAAPGSFR